MTGPITRHRGIESLKTAARWPGADRATTIILATRLAAARADAEGYRYFSELADAQPGQALPLALAGFFQARLGEDVDAALAKLDQAAATDLGPPQYFRGLALAGLPPDRRRAEQAVADLEFVLAVADQFPVTNAVKARPTSFGRQQHPGRPAQAGAWPRHPLTPGPRRKPWITRECRRSTAREQGRMPRRPVARRPAPGRGWPASGPRRLPPGTWAGREQDRRSCSWSCRLARSDHH